MDPLDDLLRPATPARPDPAARARLAQRTLGEARRQRRGRRLAGVASLLGAYAAGILTVLAVRPPEPPAEREPPALRAQLRQMAPIDDLEWRALDHPDEAAALYRAAGDRHLAGDDPANAVRCYGNALDATPPREIEVTEDDNWLLMTIKLARRKEAGTCER